MRTILYISTQTEMGGAQHSFLDLVCAVDTAQFHPLAVVNDRGDLFRRLQQLNIETEVIPFTTPLPFTKLLNPAVWVRNIVALFRLSILARRRLVSLVHCNDGAALYVAALAKLVHGIPVIFHVRWFEKGIRKSLVFLATRLWVDTVITNSLAVRSFVRDTLPGSKKDISVVYNAVDTNLLHLSLPKDTLRTELQLPSGQKLVGMIGRFVGWKNHAVFVKMAKRLCDEGAPVAFCLIGAAQFKSYTPDTDTIEQSLLGLIQSEGMQDKIHLLGYRSDIELIVSGLDILVCPSENEPFGRVVIEAMACGVPVVASNSGGIPEIITHQENGLLVPVHDDRAFADAVKLYLADQSLYDRIRTRARANVETRFSLKQLRAELGRIYDNVIQEK